MLKIRNTGDRPFNGRYRQEWIEIPSGAEIIVEDGAVHAWLGFPGTVNTDRWRQRDEEHRRVRIMWLGELMDVAGAWDNMGPKLEVYTLTGDRYWTVADDPDGTKTAGTNISMDAGKDQIVAALLELQARLQQMESAERHRVEKGTDNQPAPVDAPSKTKVDAS